MTADQIRVGGCYILNGSVVRRVTRILGATNPDQAMVHYVLFDPQGARDHHTYKVTMKDFLFFAESEVNP